MEEGESLFTMVAPKCLHVGRYNVTQRTLRR